MSATKITLYEFQGKDDPTVQVEIKCLSVKETEYVIATIDTSNSWQLNEDELALIKTFHLKVGTPITEQQLQLLAYYHSEDFSLYKNGVAMPLLNVSVVLTPQNPTNTRGTGGTRQFTAKVLPASFAQDIDWSIESATGLTISNTGLVTWTGATPITDYEVEATVKGGTSNATTLITLT